MNCPRCDRAPAPVIDTQRRADGTVDRVRRCGHCGNVFGTEYRAEETVTIQANAKPFVRPAWRDRELQKA